MFTKIIGYFQINMRSLFGNEGGLRLVCKMLKLAFSLYRCRICSRNALLLDFLAAPIRRYKPWAEPRLEPVNRNYDQCVDKMKRFVNWISFRQCSFSLIVRVRRLVCFSKSDNILLIAIWSWSWHEHNIAKLSNPTYWITTPKTRGDLKIGIVVTTSDRSWCSKIHKLK